MTPAPNDDRGEVTLRADDGARVVIQRHGAHVTSWTTADGVEQLYLSERAVFDGRSAIRGGVPVIFPQFASEGPLPKHGFARTTQWDVVAVQPGGDAPSARLELGETAETLAIWPHEFVAELRVALGANRLEVGLAVQNTGLLDLRFTAALHTYLSVADAAQTTVYGLDTVPFRDSTAGSRIGRQAGALRIHAAEVNRIYMGASHPLEVRGARAVHTISMTGFDDVVVWNPGPAGEAALGDMEPGGSRRMLCVEAACIARPVVVQPGEQWEGSQRLLLL